MSTYIYIRVSTKEQVIDGNSLPLQYKMCRQYCESNGLHLGEKSNYDGCPGVFCDPGVSAWSKNILSRPGFSSLWKIIQPGDTIVILSIDRAFRSIKDFATTWDIFKDHQVGLISIRNRIDMTTATGKLMGNIFASFAQFKSDLISQRMKEAWVVRKSLNKNPSLVVKEKKSPIITDAETLAATRHWMNQKQKDPTAPIGRVFGYTRVSTAAQKVDSQEPAVDYLVKQAMNEDGFGYGGLYHDQGISAFTVNWNHRPAGKLLWEALQPGDVICSLRVDRLFRSIIDMARSVKELTDRGIYIRTADGIDTSTQQGQQMMELLAVMAKWESAELGWRIKQGHQNSRATRGKWVTGPLPYWMKHVERGGNRIAVPDRQKLIETKQALELREQGLTGPEVSDHMENRLSHFYRRPWVPRSGASLNYAQRKNYSAEYRKNWMVYQKKMLSRSRLPNSRNLTPREWTPMTVSRFLRPDSDVCEFIEKNPQILEG